MQRRPWIWATAAAAMALVGGTVAQAQCKYPERTITIVVPSAPGGSTDFTARLIAEPLSRALGQPVVVDNKAGASGNIGNQQVAKAKPDGYTLLLAYSGYQVGNPHLFKKAGWDPIKDFMPVAMLTRAPQVVAARPNFPVNNLRELVAYAKAHPDKLNYASSGNGSIQHIAGELFKQMTGTSLTHVPYKGAGPAVQDLLGGQVDLFFTTPAHGGEPHQGRQTQGAGSHQQRTPVVPAASADNAGVGSERLHARLLVCAVCASRNAK
jgi:tripartite-type tricarboxylate transporter receptor subunit TctC